ncbi:MAG: Uma2 family endonuclease [Candidatus Flexifilum sp.]
MVERLNDPTEMLNDGDAVLDDAHAPTRLAVPRMTAEQFDAFARRPENADRILQWIDGEIYEMPSNAYASKISQIIAGEIYLYLKQNPIGHLTGEAGGYQVSGNRYAPDVAFISFARSPELAAEGYHPVAPDLAVEVDHPPSMTSAQLLTIKVTGYLLAGTTVWIIRPALRTVEVYTPGAPARRRGRAATLGGGAGRPGFTLPVRAIFAAPPRP